MTISTLTLQDTDLPCRIGVCDFQGFANRSAGRGASGNLADFEEERPHGTAAPLRVSRGPGFRSTFFDRETSADHRRGGGCPPPPICDDPFADLARVPADVARLAPDPAGLLHDPIRFPEIEVFLWVLHVRMVPRPRRRSSYRELQTGLTKMGADKSRPARFFTKRVISRACRLAYLGSVCRGKSIETLFGNENHWISRSLDGTQFTCLLKNSFSVI
jgi:hypothetical protein